jgi:hypothetical protein
MVLLAGPGKSQPTDEPAAAPVDPVQAERATRMRSAPLGDPERRLAPLTARLGLTEEQQAKVTPLLEEEIAQVKALRDDATLSAKERQTKVQQVRAATLEKIRPMRGAEEGDRSTPAVDAV